MDHAASTPVFRFAPSPNGRLHLGHAYSAWLNYALARQCRGRFLVRLEDIDTTRCTRELADACLSDLAWLGLTWEHPVRVQSQHWDDYARALEQLKAKGLVYRCFCTRSDIAAAGAGKDPDGAPLYPGTCSRLAEDEIQARLAKGIPHCWRLHMDKALAQHSGPLSYHRFALPSFAAGEVQAKPARWGDVILSRKETPASYHLSVVVDDALQGVTHVVRGADLEAATDVHALLQALLGLPPPLYHHHGLLMSHEGDKLAKSKGSETLADLRMRGLNQLNLLEELNIPCDFKE